MKKAYSGIPADTMEEACKNIIHNRAYHIEAFITAWLAEEVPDKHLRPKWLAKNVMLVEQKSDDGLKISWHLEYLDRPSFWEKIKRANGFNLFKTPPVGEK